MLEFHDIFAKHRFDVGDNTELKIKLTTEHSKPLYVQGPPTPVHLRDELHIELALMHYYGLIITLSSLTVVNYGLIITHHRKQSGKQTTDRPPTCESSLEKLLY